MVDYRIAPITEREIEGYWAAVDSVAKEYKYLSFFKAPPIENTRAFVMENISEGWPHYVALVDRLVIGWCDITSLHRPVFAHSGSLGIGVISKYRGQGVGDALMRAALKQARFIDLTRVELTVREQNQPAIAMYEKFGFVVEGVKKKAIRIGQNYENLVCMALLF